MTEKKEKKEKQKDFELSTLAVLTFACLHSNKTTLSETKVQAK